MDDASRSTIAFLESLQDAMRQLGDVWNHYQRSGARPDRPYLTLSGSPFHVHELPTAREFRGCLVLGLIAHGTDGREYELGVEVLWDADSWTVTTEAWVETDDGGQQVLRELPERVTPDFQSCQRHLAEAIRNLLRFQDLVSCGAADNPAG